MTRSRATPRAGGKHPGVVPPSNMTSSASPMLNCVDLYRRTRPNLPKCNRYNGLRAGLALGSGGIGGRLCGPETG